jgi:hypothetical protein
MCGCDRWVAIEKFAKIKLKWFEPYLSFALKGGAVNFNNSFHTAWAHSSLSDLVKLFY